MQEDDKGIATASRLPALSIRLIDGVVMRICDAIARKVAVTKWNDIKEDLQKESKVSIPLVLEQNHFEFEPGLKQIKTKSKKADEIEDDRRDKYKGQKISLYDGTILGKNGEIDHIIPRSSRYGMLNDEANLIYISKADNQKKGNDFKFLRDLHKDYKQDIFGNKSDDNFISNTLC
jgi:5-methylcytosine-specific restriction endonuclease McrA